MRASKKFKKKDAFGRVHEENFHNWFKSQDPDCELIRGPEYFWNEGIIPVNTFRDPHNLAIPDWVAIWPDGHMAWFECKRKKDRYNIKKGTVSGYTDGPAIFQGWTVDEKLEDYRQFAKNYNTQVTLVFSHESIDPSFHIIDCMKDARSKEMNNEYGKTMNVFNANDCKKVGKGVLI